jgi:hypothetical protein
MRLPLNYERRKCPLLRHWLVFNLCQKALGKGIAKIEEAIVDTGQRRKNAGAYVVVVIAGDRHIAGHANTGFEKPPDGAGRHIVIAAVAVR